MFLEVGLKAVADFVYRAYELQIGGMSPFVVINNLEYGHENFPCIQTVPSSTGDKTIKIGLRMTTDTVDHVETGGAQEIDEVVPLDKNHKVCIVCRKTESDIMSTTGHKLSVCASCHSETERYCSRDCQTRDWKRHKVTCTGRK